MDILNLPSKWALLGQSAGQGFQQGVSSGLEQLAKARLMNIQSQSKNQTKIIERARGIDALSKRLGVSEQEAQQIYDSPAAYQSPFLKNIIEEPSNKAFQENVLGALHPQSSQDANGLNILQQDQRNLQGEQPVMPQFKNNPNQATLKPKQVLDLANLALQKEQNTIKQENANRTFNQKENTLTEKKYQKYNEELYNESKAAENQNYLLNELRQLKNTGNISGPVFQQAVDRFPLLKSFLTPEDQGSRKIIASFIGDIGKVFKGNISKVKLEAFLNKFPSLSNTPEGMELIIDSLEGINNKIILRDKIRQDLIEKNGDNTPKGIDRKVDKIFNEILKNSSKSKKDTNLPTVEKENPLLSKPEGEPFEYNGQRLIRKGNKFEVIGL